MADSPRPTPEIDLGALIAGDEVAWRQFVTRYGPTIHGAARRAMARAGLSDDHVADVTQNVFVRLCQENFRLLATYDPDRASLSTWLRVVAGSAAIDYLRRQKKTVPLDAVSEAHFAEPPPDPVPLNIPDDLLTARQRLVLTLTFDRDLDVAEVASMLGVTAQTVRSLRHKALVRLRDWAAD
ncbi:MAG: sigma-70 family RNA polymerase sigma factor [Alphaproteobacteria bacterium]|nr:sigma-70 family RNA polymerase sigma factor [Alphaproteobacteria bacterium]